MIVFRHEDPAVVPDTLVPLIEEVQTGVHDDLATIEDAPGKVNSVTMFQFLFQKAIDYSITQPQDESQPESMDSGMALTPQLAESLNMASLFEILQKDPKWTTIEVIDPNKLQEGDVLFAANKEALTSHQLAIATLSMGPPMLLVTETKYDAPSIMAVGAFLADYPQDPLFHS